ncbi:unnamed protein product [Mortierella alpina]
MLFQSSYSLLVVATLAVFSANAPQAEAHSWVNCVDWRPDSKNDWLRGECMSTARRFPLGRPFGSLDSASPNRHYQQDRKNPDKALPCSNGKAGYEPGSDETRAQNPKDAYGGKYGKMTITAVGSQLCVRWPAKNHAKEYKVPDVQINLAPHSGKDPSQQELIKHKVVDLPYNNCAKEGGDDDKRPCGGCFTVPERPSGVYLLQWRWRLNTREWYTSCADIKIGSKNEIPQRSSSKNRSKRNAPKKNASKKNAPKKNAPKKNTSKKKKN